MRTRTLMFLAGSLATIATPAAAGPRKTPETPKTALYLQAGLSSGASHMGGTTVGGTIARDLGSRLAIEGSAAYLGRGMGADARSLSANLLVYLRSRREKAVPYLAAGGGIYRASFDMGNSRFYGHRSFTDPAISLGGGTRVDVGSKLFLRPDARALVGVSNGDSDTVGLFTLNLGYGL